GPGHRHPARRDGRARPAPARARRAVRPLELVDAPASGSATPDRAFAHMTDRRIAELTRRRLGAESGRAGVAGPSVGAAGRERLGLFAHVGLALAASGLSQ